MLDIISEVDVKVGLMIRPAVSNVVKAIGITVGIAFNVTGVFAHIARIPDLKVKLIQLIIHNVIMTTLSLNNQMPLLTSVE